MSTRNLVMLACASALVACGGGGSSQSVDFSDWQEAEVSYSYPYDNQIEVPPTAPVVVRFTDDVEVEESNFTLTGPDGEVPVTMKTVDDGRSVVLQPKTALAVKSDYELTLNGIKTKNGEASFPDGALNFTTRAALEGPRDERRLSDKFDLALLTPDGKELPFLDFSSLDLVLTQPVDRASVVYGETISLTQNGELVPATVLVDGNRISIDPRDTEDANGETVEPLTPDEPVTLEITSGLTNEDGDPFPGLTRELTPRDTEPRSTLVQEAAPTDPTLSCLDEGVRTSPLTGDPINCVPVIAHLLGDTTVSKQSGDVFGQLAFAPNFPDVTPLRIPRGSLLKGDPLDVNIGGEVSAGFDSGEVTVTFLSDANGYLIPNPYTDDPNAPKQLRLTMNVAFDTEDPRANGAFNQNLLQITLVGTAIADTKKGSLIVDAIGVVEPKVLGTETAHGVLSFHMESYPDQEHAPEFPEDMTSPELRSWLPGENVDKQRPGDPVILSFTEPLDPNSIEPGTNLTLTADGQDVPFDWYLDGVSVVITPEEPLQYNAAYQVVYTDGITDIAGNPAISDTLDFTLPPYEGEGREPIVTTAYPGFPCAFDKTTWDIGEGDHGICRGGKDDDDHLPVMPMPGTRAIQTQFSQVIDEQSVQRGKDCDAGSFRVEKIAAAGETPDFHDQDGKKKYTCESAVPGTLSYKGRTLTFVPDEPWEDGAIYRYILMSENHDFTAEDCRNGEALCTVNGKPLQTAMLEAPGEGQGGPNMEIYFRGASDNDKVFQELRNLPAYDVNADFVHQDSEPQPQEDPNNAGQYLVPPNATQLEVQDTGGLLLNANVGCDIGDDCPDQKFIYLTGALDTEIAGYDEQEDAVRVNIYPTQLVTSSVDVYAKLLLILFPIDQVIATGPQVMRIRYQEDEDGNRTEPVTGWIRDGGDGPVFETTLDLYLSAPYLAPEAIGIQLKHDLYSYPLTLKLSGDVTFLDDGRLQIEQINVEAPDDIKVDISLDDNGVLKAASMTLGIPQGGANLNYLSNPIKP